MNLSIVGWTIMAVTHLVRQAAERDASFYKCVYFIDDHCS